MKLRHFTQCLCPVYSLNTVEREINTFTAKSNESAAKSACSNN